MELRICIVIQNALGPCSGGLGPMERSHTCGRRDHARTRPYLVPRGGEDPFSRDKLVVSSSL